MIVMDGGPEGFYQGDGSGIGIDTRIKKKKKEGYG